MPTMSTSERSDYPQWKPGGSIADTFLTDVLLERFRDKCVLRRASRPRFSTSCATRRELDLLVSSCAAHKAFHDSGVTLGPRPVSLQIPCGMVHKGY